MTKALVFATCFLSFLATGCLHPKDRSQLAPPRPVSVQRLAGRFVERSDIVEHCYRCDISIHLFTLTSQTSCPVTRWPKALPREALLNRVERAMPVWGDRSRSPTAQLSLIRR